MTSDWLYRVNRLSTSTCLIFYRFESRLAKASSSTLRGLWFLGEQAYRIVGIAAVLAI